MNTPTRITAALTVAAASLAAYAQSSPTPTTAASQPNAVGVTPEAARTANEKAIQRSDVATVVRTGPTAADRARQVGNKVESSMTDAKNSDGNAVANANRNATLAPRVDRN
jgi:hypothetical protein